ncbi:hypothetical protein DW964_08165 [Ruminococcus sp. AM47-2BH]|nr:hypothetical protein DW964_08165 [Ruminococcus sp. AM47-2BH]
MAYSDDNNFTTMQEEAIRRVREMQRRSRSIVGASLIVSLYHLMQRKPLALRVLIAHKKPLRAVRF